MSDGETGERVNRDTEQGTVRCILSTILGDAYTCENQSMPNRVVCDAHESYYPELSPDQKADLLREIGSAAHHIAVCKAEGQIEATQQRRLEALVQDLESRDIPAQQHATRVKNIYWNNDPGTASKRIATEQESFIAEHVDEYDATY